MALPKRLVLQKTLDHGQTAWEGILSTNYFIVADNVVNIQKIIPSPFNFPLPLFIYRYFVYLSPVDYYDLFRILYLSKLSTLLLLKHKACLLYTSYLYQPKFVVLYLISNQIIFNLISNYISLHRSLTQSGYLQVLPVDSL